MLDRPKTLEEAKELLLETKSHDRREPDWAYRHGVRRST
jgi:hypothetical protein